MSKRAFVLHNVQIDRGSTVLVSEVPEHEIEVLRAVHGRDAVQDMGEVEDDIELNIGADAEWTRLQRCYHRANAPDPVARAYPAGSRELERFGFELGRANEAAPAQSSFVKHPKPKVDKGKKAE